MPTTDRWTTNSAELIMPQRCDTQVCIITVIPKQCQKVTYATGHQVNNTESVFGGILRAKAAGIRSQQSAAAYPSYVCIFAQDFLRPGRYLEYTGPHTDNFIRALKWLSPGNMPKLHTAYGTEYNTSIVNFTLTVNKC